MSPRLSPNTSPCPRPLPLRPSPLALLLLWSPSPFKRLSLRPSPQSSLLQRATLPRLTRPVRALSLLRALLQVTQLTASCPFNQAARDITHPLVLRRQHPVLVPSTRAAHHAVLRC